MLRRYFQTLAHLVWRPGRFFEGVANRPRAAAPAIIFLSLSSTLFTVASLLSRDWPCPLISGAIFWTNAMGMPMIAAAVACMLMPLFSGRLAHFLPILSIYAFSAGATLPAAWPLHFIWIAEPWKWILIGIGLNRVCRLKGYQAGLIIIASMVTITGATHLALSLIGR